MILLNQDGDQLLPRKLLTSLHSILCGLLIQTHSSRITSVQLLTISPVFKSSRTFSHPANQLDPISFLSQSFSTALRNKISIPLSSLQSPNNIGCSLETEVHGSHLPKLIGCFQVHVESGLISSDSAPMTNVNELSMD